MATIWNLHRKQGVTDHFPVYFQYCRYFDAPGHLSLSQSDLVTLVTMSHSTRIFNKYHLSHNCENIFIIRLSTSRASLLMRKRRC